jgi:hypothetical protein
MVEKRQAFVDRNNGRQVDALLRPGPFVTAENDGSVHRIPFALQFFLLLESGAGYFIASTHDFQKDIPTDNIVAPHEEARELKFE